MNKGPTKEEKIFATILVTALICLILILFFVIIPWNDAQRLEHFKEHQETKTGTIILVIPDPDGKVYFEDGAIMEDWQREDYSEFRQYINKRVRIVYGEIKMCDDCSVKERMLFEIEEVK